MYTASQDDVITIPEDEIDTTKRTVPCKYLISYDGNTS